MGAMVKRDRNHPSIIIWSFCNEAGCEGSQEQGGPAFREIAYHFDGSRELPRYRWHLGCILVIWVAFFSRCHSDILRTGPVLANMFTFNDLLR